MILTKERLDEFIASPMLKPKMVLDLLDTIADLERQRDTAHAAAIQTAANLVDKEQRFEFGACLDNADIRELRDAILSLTPAASQRLYNLRIAEALEAVYKLEAIGCGYNNRRLRDRLIQERLAAVSAEVERLKGEV